MSIKLTDSRLVLMNAASRRNDRCLEPTKGMNGAAVRKISEKLIAAGLAREVKAKATIPIWRRDEEAAYALKLTAAGLKAIAVDDEDAGSDAGEPKERLVAKGTPDDESPKTASANAAPTPHGDGDAILIAPREGSKIAKVITLLQREQGATLAEIIGATDWLPHTSRAALTGLRKRGYAIERRSRGEGPKGYVIVEVAASRSAA